MAKALKERQSSIKLRWQTVSTVAQARSFRFGPQGFHHDTRE